MIILWTKDLIYIVHSFRVLVLVYMQLLTFNFFSLSTFTHFEKIFIFKKFTLLVWIGLHFDSVWSDYSDELFWGQFIWSTQQTVMIQYVKKLYELGGLKLTLSSLIWFEKELKAHTPLFEFVCVVNSILFLVLKKLTHSFN